MTATAIATKRPRLRRRTALLLAAFVLLAAGWFAYVAKYGECDFKSKFCILNIAGTRSEIGCEWDSWNCYVSTWGNDPATHTLF